MQHSHTYIHRETRCNITEKIAEWNQFLHKHNLEAGEGHSGEVPFERNFYFEKPHKLAKKLNKQILICETGFNKGHSALIFLEKGMQRIVAFVSFLIDCSVSEVPSQ